MSTRIPFISYLLPLATVMVLTGCISGQSGSDYGRSQVRGEQAIRLATVVDTRFVQIDGARTGIGAAAGTVVGAVAGAARSNNDNTSNLLGAIGGVLGGVIGQGIEQTATKTKGIEVVVKNENGQLTAITQQDDGTIFKPGDTVRIMKQDGVTRIAPHR